MPKSIGVRRKHMETLDTDTIRLVFSAVLTSISIIVAYIS